ncbi:MAG: tRNA (N6-threonylcarbamoyladenosine(37)-N6)-methyltransferase TrmO [bacterium]|nr:tRNA (N6-threonylcarbamoyladenosine(37)-N6)-methyltransferase TrmO [bacterium]
MGAGATLATCGVLGTLNATANGADDKFAYNADTVYKISPIGKVHNQKGKPVRLEIYEKYSPALHRLDNCSHVMVLWWFHKNDTPERRKILKVYPRRNRKNPLTGVFATHSPVRPNLIAVTVCKILSVKENIVTIEGIDAFDDTPIIDLKSAGSRTPKLLPRANEKKT